jgi:hypothetical protein
MLGLGARNFGIKPSTFTDNRIPFHTVLRCIKPLFVKTGFYPVFNALITNIAILLSFAPFLLMLWKKLQYMRIYALVGIYWLTVALLNQFSWVGITDNWDIQSELLFARNLIGSHFALIILIYCSKIHRRNWASYSFLFYLVFELSALAIGGFRVVTGVVINGTGSVLIVTGSVLGLAGYFKEVEHTVQENSIAFIHSSFLFAYASVAMIYGLNYLNITAVNDPNEFFLYYVGLLLSSLLTSYGFWHYAARPALMKSKK